MKRIAIVGAGGTGSHVAHQLAMHIGAQYYMDIEELPEVHIYDSEPYRMANYYRQVVNTEMINKNKAASLCANLNEAFAVHFKGYQKRFNYRMLSSYDLVFLCVDSHDWRVNIRYPRSVPYTVIDCGNSADYGQVLTYHVKQNKIVGKTYKNMNFPAPEQEDSKSCNLQEALDHQSLFINKMVATVAVLHYQKLIEHHDFRPMQSFINLNVLQVKTTYEDL